MSTWEKTLEELIQGGNLSGSLKFVDHLLLQTGTENKNQAASLLVLRGQLLRELGQPAVAANTFLQAGQLRGARLTIRVVALFESAREFVGLREYSAAMDILALALKEYKAHVPGEDVKHSTRESTLVDSGLDPSAPSSEVVGRILLLRAQAARLSQNRDLALQDVSEIIDMPSASAALRAAAFLDRGAIQFEKGESAKAIEDFLIVLAMEGGLERHKCDATYNLSLIYASKGDYRSLHKSISAFLRSPLPPAQMKKTLAGSIEEILADVATDEAVAVKSVIAGFMLHHK